MPTLFKQITLGPNFPGETRDAWSSFASPSAPEFGSPIFHFSFDTVVSVKVNELAVSGTFLVGNQKFKIAKQRKLL
jgi:hypothetical protein